METKDYMSRCQVLLVFVDPILSPFVQPYGVTILSAILSEAGIINEVICPFNHEYPIDYLREKIHQYKPQIIGYSLRNLDVASFSEKENTNITFLELLKDVIRCGKLPGQSPLRVIGGTGFSIAPKEILSYTNADIGFVGPSEYDFLEFCKRYLSNKKPSFKEEQWYDLGSAIVLGSNPILSPSRLNFTLSNILPNFSTSSLEIAKLLGGTIPVRTKTGCSQRCSYCVIPYIEPCIQRPLDDTIEELRQIELMGCGDRVFIADGELNLPSKERTISLCKKIYSEFGSSIQWRCYACPSTIDLEMVKWLEKSGCIWVSLTVDSYDDSALLGMGKGFNASRAIQATSLFMTSSIELNVNILLGGPGESKKSIENTLERCSWAVDGGAHLSPIFGLRVYPGTPLYLECKKDTNIKYVTWDGSSLDLGHICKPYNKIEMSNMFASSLKDIQNIHYAKTNLLDDDPNVDIANAFSHFLEGNFSTAIDRLNSLCILRPYCTRATLALAKILFAIGKTEDSDRLLNNIDI